jgi:hypothetical protein
MIFRILNRGISREATDRRAGCADQRFDRTHVDADAPAQSKERKRVRLEQSAYGAFVA